MSLSRMMPSENAAPSWIEWRRERPSAQALLDRFGLDRPPFQVDRILTEGGIKLALGRGGPEAGRLTFDDRAARVWINLEEPEEQRRVTLAYLVGRLLLHPFGEYKCPLGAERTYANAEALTFAKQLLMPGPLVTRLHEEEGTLPLHSRFGVPRGIMQERLVDLGLESPAMPMAPAASTVRPPLLPKARKPSPPPAPPIGGEEEEESKTDPAIVQMTDLLGGHRETSEGAERRQFQRVAARIEVRFEQAGQAAKALRAFSMDVSLGGLCLRTRRQYAVGELLRLTMKVADEDFSLSGAVVWTRDGAIGVRFQDVSEQDRQRLTALVQSFSRPMFRPQD